MFVVCVVFVLIDVGCEMLFDLCLGGDVEQCCRDSFVVVDLVVWGGVFVLFWEMLFGFVFDCLEDECVDFEVVEVLFVVCFVMVSEQLFECFVESEVFGVIVCCLMEQEVDEELDDDLLLIVVVLVLCICCIFDVKGCVCDDVLFKFSQLCWQVCSYCDEFYDFFVIYI